MNHLSNSDQESTLVIIKPEAVKSGKISSIIARYEANRFSILRMKMVRMNQRKAESFYEIHKDRPFFTELVNYMISGPVLIMVVNKKNAVADNRLLIGATDPQLAAPGTIRAELGVDISNNAVHGSDSLETARNEIDFWNEIW